MPSLKHPDFLQSAIGRMGRNSFQMKSWNVALASAVIGLAAAKDSHPRRAALAFVPYGFQQVDSCERCLLAGTGAYELSLALGPHLKFKSSDRSNVVNRVPVSTRKS
jgi:hypothetical protein